MAQLPILPTATESLHQGRDAFARRAWADAFARLSAADRDAPLAAEDLERLATAAYLVGEHSDSEASRTRAHHEFLAGGQTERAARSAFWIGFHLLQRGETARGGGWIARAQRLLDDAGRDCVERGYLVLPVALRSIFGGDNAGAYESFGQAATIGERFGEPDLVALARHGCGRALIRLGEVEDGVALLDEAMAAVEAGDVSPLVAGDIYCSVIEACHEIFDMRRAQEWTAALTQWCEAQPDLAPYRGQCLVRRAEIMQLHGAWPDALEEARRACDHLTKPPGERAAGAAFYQLAEIHRLRGEFDEADEAYRQATKWGRSPHPGLALLRLAQGQLDAAAAAIRRLLAEAEQRRARSNVLPAFVDIMLAAGDVAASRAGADELAQIAAELDAPMLHAIALTAEGAVLLAENDARKARDVLRDAWTTWSELESPYDAARVRVLMALACRALGDEDTASVELEAARWALQQLGAAPDLARIDALTRAVARDQTHRLTARELQVLRRVAAGETNKDIAAELFISERTVERHVSNIFMKLGVASRAAATAFAYENQLV
ncbi:MAG: LuxR C-terminal-related transcriptional regulator [Longimicrobiales bacterium]